MNIRTQEVLHIQLRKKQRNPEIHYDQIVKVKNKRIFKGAGEKCLATYQESSTRQWISQQKACWPERSCIIYSKL